MNPTYNPPRVHAAWNKPAAAIPLVASTRILTQYDTAEIISPLAAKAQPNFNSAEDSSQTCAGFSEGRSIRKREEYHQEKPSAAPERQTSEGTIPRLRKM